ncbi:MAG: serine/threonine protein kinase [Schlesneria sp.]|nr:serine/threonine protein kinase [Schlesneria sp.]
MNEASTPFVCACPSLEVLASFARGQMAVVEIDLLGEHVIQCTRCESLLDTLQKDRNTVFSRLRQAARRESNELGELLAEREYQEFARNACAIKLANSVATETTKVYSPQPGRSASSLPTMISRYLITREIGRGGFATVYLAHDPHKMRQVAIKIPRRDKFISPENLDRFLGEARIGAALDHPSIVPVLDWGTADGIGPFVVMDYVNGQTLAELLDARQMDRRTLVEIMINVAQALHHAHKLGLVHRDVKPQNILIDAGIKPFVVDFGLAIRDEELWNHRGELAGTRAYMAPEQVRRESHRLDGRTDLWALGVILFQALTTKLPFSGGTVAQLEDEIQHRDPKPPRQIDDTIPNDLERICLKCLSKKMTDRYSTALDFANELRRTSESGSALARPPEVRSDSVIPKGVRPFGSEDQHFFLELLPGPRDAMGLPDSIRSWKARLDIADPGLVPPIAVLYGPSGCGKSSFVRAGLLPRLGSHIVHAYVDACGQDVELRLLRTLQHKYRDLPKDANLVETIASLRAGNYFPIGNKKCLIVLDQFEQWLHSSGANIDGPLIRALRQCDGEHVQCLLLVRDDFWMALTRFMNELEIPLSEGQNCAAVDLFNSQHARTVLTLFGKSFGTLPTRVDSLTVEQNSFLDSSIEQLSFNGRVACVRLALFAEMVKSKPWVPVTLRQLGGVEGVGVTFLEESFGKSAPARHRLHREPIRAILAALLPKDGTEIRDQNQSIASLLTISGCIPSTKQFEEILRILDQELRLITPVDSFLAINSRPNDDPVESPLSRQYYQLTHDYLVPSIRDWLNRKRRETRRGRAELLLEERARLWSTNCDRKQLPSLFEWFRILSLTRRSDWNTHQLQLMRVASRYYTTWTTLRLLGLAVVAVVGIGAYGYLRGSWLVDSLRTADTGSAGLVIRQLQSYSYWTRAKLRGKQPDSNQQLHFELAAFALGDEIDLTPWILEASPKELELCLTVVNNGRFSRAVSERLWKVLEDDTRAAEYRFRAACGLASLDPDNNKWASVADRVADLLLLQESHLADEWVELMRPVGHRLVDALQNRFLQPVGRSGSERYVAAVALAEFCERDLNRLVAMLKNSTSEQVLFLRKLEQKCSAATAILEAEFAATASITGIQQDQELFEQQYARIGASLILLGQPEAVWLAFEHQSDPTRQTLLVDQLAAWHIDPFVLWEQLQKTSSPSAKYLLILALGEYTNYELISKSGDDLLSHLINLQAEDPDPSVHSAAGWLLGRLNPRQTQSLTRHNTIYSSIEGGLKWHNDNEGHTMTIINTPGEFLMGSPDNESDRQADELRHARRIDYSFAMATSPVTIAQYRRSGGIDRSNRESDINQPIDFVDLEDAMKYCNWLSSKNHIPEHDWCYQSRDAGGTAVLHPVDTILSKPGYRLPTEAEWEFACRAGTVSTRFCGNSQKVLSKYAWLFENSEGKMHPVAQLRPNQYGLFDLYGNVGQWCQTSYHDYDQKRNDGVLTYQLHGSMSFRGCTYDSRPKVARSGRRGRSLSAPLSAIGFRVARSLP